ncbi:protein PF3D7_1417600 [Helicoverpa armigera]|uniref:protein PF3D7_1417600 n=1 Tax=Helicoverpa armigera TaxID=29058 RepID=UPI003083CBA8
MDPVNNNQFEIVPAKSKRKIATPCPNAYLNPALDILANEDRMCNTAMEITQPIKKRKRTRSCGDIATFDNSALDLGVKNTAVNKLLAREIENVRKNVRLDATEDTSMDSSEPIYANLTGAPQLPPRNDNSITFRDITQDSCQSQSMQLNNEVMNMSVTHDDIDSGISVLEQKSLSTMTNDDTKVFSPITNIQTNVTNQVFINNSNNLNLSFIDRLGLDSPNLSNQSLFYDDDLNESNIMEIKTITIITKKKRINTKNTNPFLDPNIVNALPRDIPSENPFLNLDSTKPELEYSEEVLTRPAILPNQSEKVLEPRRLFGDTNSTISTVNESLDGQPEYENIDNYRPESPVYENIDEVNEFNKQSRILGHDVSQFSAVDIINLNKNAHQDSSNDSNDSKKVKNPFLKVGNRLSKRVFKTLRKTFKGEKTENNVTINPYEVPRKLPKQKTETKESGIENPALNLDNSDEIEIEEIDEHEYETVKTIRNTHLNMNITPLKERSDNADISHNKTNTPGKKVRFDSTLNQEKVITGNSFDYDIQSPGFDAKIDKYHDELENCINERKFLQQNM